MVSPKRKVATAAFLTITATFLAACTHQPQGAQTPSTQQVEWAKSGNTYTYHAEYESPGGKEENNFHLTLNPSGTIDSVTVDILVNIPTSIEYQQGFAKEVRGVLIGKNISEVQGVDVLSGASLTTAAFNDALEKLQSQLST